MLRACGVVPLLATPNSLLADVHARPKTNRAQARWPRPHPGRVARPGQRVRRRPGAGLPDERARDGGGLARARARRARRAHRRDAPLRRVARLRGLGHAAGGQALDRRGGPLDLAAALAPRSALPRGSYPYLPSWELAHPRGPSLTRVDSPL